MNRVKKENRQYATIDRWKSRGGNPEMEIPRKNQEEMLEFKNTNRNAECL